MTQEEESFKKRVFEKLKELKNKPPYYPNSIKISEIAKNNPDLFKKYCFDWIYKENNFDYCFSSCGDFIYRKPNIELEVVCENLEFVLERMDMFFANQTSYSFSAKKEDVSQTLGVIVKYQ